MTCRIAGTGAYLPRQIVKNEFFAHLQGSNYSKDMGDVFHLGCEERRHASIDETTIAMGIAAARQALDNAHISADEIDFVLWSAMVGDHLDAQDAGVFMHEMGIVNAAHWTISVACSSFLPMITAADMLIKNGRAAKVLVVTVSNWVNRILDKSKDYSINGDGAAAVVLERSEQESHIVAFEQTNGEFGNTASLSSPWRTQKSEFVEFITNDESRAYFLDGRATLPAMRCLLEARKHSLRPRWTIFSQFSTKAMQCWSDNLDIDMSINLNTLPFTGHLTTANHPFILHHYTVVEPKISRGDLILFFGVGGGGYTGSVLWRY